MKNKKIIIVILLIVSLSGNVLLGTFLMQSKSDGTHVWNLSMTNGNSHQTYFSIHNIGAAQKVALGEGVKIGILDHYFGFDNHDGLYQNGKDFIDEYDKFCHVSEHGFWMTNTLKEIAPKCEVYALNTLSNDETKKVNAMAEAIDWAIENKLDILTYSDASIDSNENRAILDQAVKKAAANGILTTFIHYDNPLNLEPSGIYDNTGDITIFDYDYNLILEQDFQSYGADNIPSDGSCMLFYSNSSMSPVLAGMVALLMSADKTLTAKEGGEILKKTAIKKLIEDPFSLEQIERDNVVDMKSALETLLSSNSVQ